MDCKCLFFYLFLVLNCFIRQSFTQNTEFTLKRPSVFLSIIARNEEANLPTYFAYIEQLNYPKERITILIQTDHNEDDTYGVLLSWKENVKDIYKNITIINKQFPKTFNDSKGPTHWSKNRHVNILKLRQNALEEARRSWADYIFYMDVDNFLINTKTLNILIAEQQVIIAPLLKVFHTKSAYSNFWAGVNEDGYYKRVPEYFPVLKREHIGTYYVPMIHSTFLIDLRSNLTDKLQFYPVIDSYKREVDDILVFAHSAHAAGMKLAICNKQIFGYMMETCTNSMSVDDRHIMFTDAFVDYAAYHDPLLRSANVPHTFPTATYGRFDEVYMVNLKRRTDRFQKMNIILKELGIKYKHFEAVDGRKLTKEMVKDMGIVGLPGFKDPFLERPLTLGEIGCFLSHWYIWLEIIERGLDMVLVLEDDVRFEPDFNRKLEKVLADAKEIEKTQPWDLMYLGRKHMARTSEYLVEGSKKIVWAKYSYWTLGYIVRLSGAKKLVAGDPMQKLVPVDEYIPIMFDDHPETAFKERFAPRTLLAWSADPLLLFPTHYVGDQGYISDTEDTLSHEGEDVQHFREKKKMKLQSDHGSSTTKVTSSKPEL